METEIVLCGQRSFGRAVLETLSGVVAVVAPENDVLAKRARTLRLPVYPEIGPDLARGRLVVAAHSHAFVGRRTREAAADVIGYHPSLLPRHRGRDAVAWTIRMGDPIAGGSVYRLTGQVDGGPILRQDWCHVDPSWSASDLWREKLFPMGVELLAAQVAAFDAFGRLVGEPQNPAVATWEPALDSAPIYRPELLELPA